MLKYKRSKKTYFSIFWWGLGGVHEVGPYTRWEGLLWLLLFIKKVLLILAISNKPKRVFLGGCYIILWERI